MSLMLFKAFASVNIEDGKGMKSLTEAFPKDYALVKQVCCIPKPESLPPPHFLSDHGLLAYDITY